MQNDLLFLYRQLRLQLDVAYAAPVWDSEHIDRITRDMLALERSLAAKGVVAPLASFYSGSPTTARQSQSPQPNRSAS